MKKLFLIIIFLLLITGCTPLNQKKVTTILEQNNQCLISIHYPKTNISTIDKKVNKYVSKKYQNFKQNQKDCNTFYQELNMDYTYYIHQDKIHTVSITTYNNSYLLNPTEEKIYITYDSKINKILFLKDLFEEEKDFIHFTHQVREKLIQSYKTTLHMEWLEETIQGLYQQFQNFTFNDQTLTLTLETKKLLDQKNTITLTFALDKIKSKIKKEERKEKTETTIKVESIIDSTKPVIALTFDDGPTEHTEEILDILQKENACATFFVLGNKVDLYQDTLIRAVKLGNEIGNHSYNHKWLSRLPKEEIKEQIQTTQEKVKHITGIYPRYLRPTYGSINNKIRNATNLKIALWNIDPKDWKNKSSNEIANDVLKYANDEKIILMHDNHKRTVQAVQKIITELKKKDYQFVTMSELEEIQKIRNYP